MHKFVVFDLDGTLLDSLPDIHYNLTTTLETFGLPTHNLDSVRAMVGHGLAALIRDAIPESARPLQEQLLHDFRTRYQADPGSRTKPYPGMVQLLTELRLKGSKTGILTNKHHPIATQLVMHFFPGLLDLVQGEQAGLPAKPHPDGLWSLVERAGVDHQETIFIGDSETDIQTARNAGIACIGVSWGFRSIQELIVAGADQIANNYLELRSMLGIDGIQA